MFNKKQSCILYLYRNGFILFINFYSSITKFVFLQTIVKDLDLINEDQLRIQIKSLIESYKIPAGVLIIILTETVLFQKDIPNHAAAEYGQPELKEGQNEKIEKFLDSVPFENVLSKNVPLQNGVRIIATNKDLVDEIPF